MKIRIVCNDLELSFSEDDPPSGAGTSFAGIAPFLASALGSLAGSSFLRDVKIERNETPPAEPAAADVPAGA
jgi:hypothetical protein